MKQNTVAIFIMITFTRTIPVFAKAPLWFSESILKKNGKTLEVSCSGQGPDKSTANKVGMDQCRGISLQYVEGHTVKTRSLSIEDNWQAAWHSESSTEADVTNLDCEPFKQECIEQDASWTCYLFCRFNLKNARLSQVKETSVEDSQASPSLIVNQSEAGFVPMSKKSTPQESLIQSQNHQILFSSIPACDSILVVGQSRIIKCEGVQTILIYPTDKELIVRAKGYKPKHIYLQSDRKPTGYSPILQVEVILEK